MVILGSWLLPGAECIIVIQDYCITKQTVSKFFLDEL